MKREIKFRAWDGYRKIMVPFDSGVINFHEGKLYEIHPELKIMQYTGLKDKNGKEIYEGDIVEVYEEGFEVDKNIYEIKWYGDEGYPAFDCEGHIDESNHLSSIAQGNDWICKIIGNIYENPELLTEKEDTAPEIFKGTNEALDKLTIKN